MYFTISPCRYQLKIPILVRKDYLTSVNFVKKQNYHIHLHFALQPM